MAYIIYVSLLFISDFSICGWQTFEHDFGWWWWSYKFSTYKISSISDR